jgi:hypothetical protein
MNHNIKSCLANIEAQLCPVPERDKTRHEQKPPFDYEGFRVLSEQFFMRLPEGMRETGAY